MTLNFVKICLIRALIALVLGPINWKSSINIRTKTSLAVLVRTQGSKAIGVYPIVRRVLKISYYYRYGDCFRP